MKFRSVFKFHPTIPITPWTAPSPWTLSLQRLSVLTFGLIIFGIGDALIITSGLGSAPWTVLAQGLSIQTELSIGTSTFIISVIVLLFWLPLSERPGLGTFANIVVIALALDFTLSLITRPLSWLSQIAMVLVGICLVAIGSMFYLTCGLGAGPRDGWMTGIHHRWRIPIARVRFSIEFTVLSLGWLLGGIVGIGTLLFALLIGPAIALSCSVVAQLTSE
jgi:uncharacterized membrane protein YczE